MGTATSRGGPFANGMFEDPFAGDGQGTLALFSTAYPNEVHATFLGRDGSQRTLDERRLNDFGPIFLPQASGFQIFSGQDASLFALHTYSTNGVLLSRTQLGEAQVMATALDFAGGSLLLRELPVSPSDPHAPWSTGWVIIAQRFSSAGSPRAGQANVAADRSGNSRIASLHGAVNLAGHTLVAWSFVRPGGIKPGPVMGRWLDRSGNALTGEFKIGDTGGGFAYRLEPLLDASVAVLDGSQWVARIRSASASVGPAPDWLKIRPQTRLALRPNARGYALMFDQPYPDPSVSCARAVHVTLFAPAGNWCGSFDFPADRDGMDTSHRCFSTAAMARDGTVVLRTQGSDSSFGAVTNHRWWPGLLR
jgi:hypothetical protein